MKLEQVSIQLLAKKNLTKSQAFRLFRNIFCEQLSKAQTKAILLLLARKGETAAEITGCLNALQSLEPPYQARVQGLIDTCGTGGDGSHSLNISTLAALVVAGSGGKVAKHGNRSISSKCGSSDLMEAFGIPLDAGRKRMVQAIKKTGIGYFHAPFFHPVFSRMQPLRRELKTRTIFNLLGPLANPLKIEAQVLGVSRIPHLKLFAEVLRQKKIKRALVCSSEDGLDEISTAAPTRLAWVTPSRIRYETLRPQKLGFRRARKNDYRGGSVQKNRALSAKILKGVFRGPLRDLVVINAAAGLVVSGIAKNLKQGIILAEKTLDHGNAYKALLKLKKISRQGKGV